MIAQQRALSQRSPPVALPQPFPVNDRIIHRLSQRSNVLHTRSATVDSMRLKKKTPPTKTRATMAEEASRSRLGAWPRPVMAQRNPSITPAIGFNPYSHRHFSGTSVLGYATGDANIQNCTRNGITYRTSRYSAFSADNHNPTPSAVKNASASKAGSHSAASVGRIPYATVKIASTANPIAKSTRPESAAEIGRMSRGK